MNRIRVSIPALAACVLAGCSSVSQNTGASTASAAATPAAETEPVVPIGAALGGALGGPVGAALSNDDRKAAWEAQIAALDSGQKRSWRGSHGVFGWVEAGAETGDGCRRYSQTIYVAGRRQPWPGGRMQAGGRKLENAKLSFDETLASLSDNRARFLPARGRAAPEAR